MTEDQFNRERHLKSLIKSHTVALNELSDNHNFLCLPDEMFARQEQEKADFLKSEIEKFEMEFAEL